MFVIQQRKLFIKALTYLFSVIVSMGMNMLHLEDCLDDSPQTRALLGVYERDCDWLLEFSQDINAACQKVAQAQNELALATQAFTQKLKDFQESDLSGSSDEKFLGPVVQQLATSMDEVSSFHAVLYSELSENMEYHSSQFLSNEMTEYLRLKASFQVSDKVHEEASSKLARVSKKNKSEKGWQEATDQLYAARKTFHNTSMLYCCCLNDLQTKKKVGILKPIISFLHSQIGFFKMGAELGKRSLEETLTKLSEELTKIEKEVKDNRDLSVERMDRLDAESTRAYIPDPPASMDFPDLPVDVAKMQISGYLFSRSRSGLLTQWHRTYFFTQGGNLMQQSKKEVAGQLFMDLDGCSVGDVDVDDRRNVFQIISADGKHTSMLQGESKQKCQEWISTIRNISAGLYLEDDPREAIKQARRSLVAESTSSDSPQEIKKPPSAETPTSQAPEKSRSGSLEAKHDTHKPFSMFSRLKQAATNFITPEEKQTKEQPPQQPSSKKSESKKLAPQNHPPGEMLLPAQPPIKTPSPDPGYPADKSSGDPSANMVLDSTEPILFDLPSPVLEQHGTPQNANESMVNEDANSQKERQNPFTSPGGDELGFKAMFIVRFLGCKKIHPGSNLDASIADTICQVMTARAVHKMFKMNELHLIISDHDIRLVDPTTQLNRESFPVATVLRIKTHIDNPRLLGFVAHHKSSNQFQCYTFESNADGDDVCCSVNTARAMEQSKVEHEEDKKQREMEMNLEEQSKMIIASSSAVIQEVDVEDSPATVDTLVVENSPTTMDGEGDNPEVTE